MEADRYACVFVVFCIGFCFLKLKSLEAHNFYKQKGARLVVFNPRGGHLSYIRNKAYTLIGVLPDAHSLLRSQVQCIALRDAKRLVELINIAHHTVHTELIRRVRIH